MGFFNDLRESIRYMRSEARAIPAHKAPVTSWKRLRGHLLDALFPPQVKCGLCGVELGEDFPWNLCPACVEGLLPVGDFGCRRCGRLVGPFAPQGMCTHCLGEPAFFDGGLSGFVYNDAAQELIFGLKYHDKPWLADSLAAQNQEAVARYCRQWGLRHLVPVPIHRERLAERGYNQAFLLAEALAHQIPGAAVVQALERIRPTEPQNRLGLQERRVNIRGAFALAEQTEALPERVLLVDDVLTTGSTLGECARVLKAGGVAEVHLFTYASVGN